MHSTVLLISLSFLLSITNALPQFLEKRANETLAQCQDILDNGLNGTCYDTLGVDAWVKNWNRTTTTCEKNELWANCFMRLSGVPPAEGLGCAQMGPNTCNEPTLDLVATGTPEQVYTAVSIWSLQQLYTAIYNDIITSPNGSSYISSAWTTNNSSTTTPHTGKSLLATILFADDDPRTQFLGLQMLTDVPIPGVDDTPIPSEAEASRVLGGVLASYLESAMTNFTLGGYWGMARDGKLLV